MNNSSIFNKLFIFEMANNHMGDSEHGLRIIREFWEETKQFDFKKAIKFQYRDIDTFIHPCYKDRQDIKYVKRFMETRLSEEQFLLMKNEASKLGYITVCTAFDEKSVDLIQKHGFDIIKIASCSFTDWSLLERIAQAEIPIIASTAGVALEDIDKVVSFFEHRNKKFCLMHCVGAYPTPDNELELNQIDFFKKRYPNITIGYSTHEKPENYDAIKIAIAKGAQIFERHVGVETEKYKLNAYSSTPHQIKKWLEAAKLAYEFCGTENRRKDIGEKERNDLIGLKRGVFSKIKITKGQKIKTEHLFLAIPNFPEQLLADDLSKYNEFIALEDIPALSPIKKGQVKIKNLRYQILEIVKKICNMLKESGVKVPNKLELEISHHYGLENFYQTGCSILTCVNREYCKKIIILLPGQENPCHFHKSKEETFHVLYGELNMNIDGKIEKYKAGDIIIVERNAKHSFFSGSGTVFEEVSTTHYKNDSFYEDYKISQNTDRKTHLTFWADWLNGEIK